jgi:hypothetical protein
VKEENAEMNTLKSHQDHDHDHARLYYYNTIHAGKRRTFQLLCRVFGLISAEEARAVYSPILMMQRRLSPLAIRSNAVLISEKGTLWVMNFSSSSS